MGQGDPGGQHQADAFLDCPRLACTFVITGRAIMKTAVRKSETPRRRSAPRGNERRLVTQHPRRRVLSLAAGAAALPAVSQMAWAQAYPTRPVRIIVGLPAGASND